MTARSPSVRSVNVLFAPGLTRIWFSPARSTMTTATPDGPYVVRRFDVSTPDADSRALIVTPNESEPIAPRNTQRPPARAAAIAWFAPLPPGVITK